MKPTTLVLIVVAAFAAVPALSASRERDDTAVFAKIKTLEGTWKGTGREGSSTPMPMSVRYHVVAGGSAVEETIAPGTPHEMVTMFYLDGKRLALTHYCVMQNQPHMTLASDSTGSQFHFAFDGGVNCPADAPHMDSVVFTIAASNHLKARWGMSASGKEMTHMDMDLTRQP